MGRSIRRLGLLVSLAGLAAACDGGTSATTEGGGGTTSSTTTSMTTGGGGAGAAGGGGAGGATTGGTGGVTGGGGTGGATGGGGTGGTTMGTEVCGNGTDDDGDGDADCADTDCASEPMCGSLVINEVDYDNPGTDTAEFIEIFNGGASAVELSGLSVVIVDGADGMPKDEIPLAGTLVAGKYLVLAGVDVTGIDPEATVMMLPHADSNLENANSGTPDGVALYDTTNQVLIDALSYEGAITNAMIDGGMFDLVSGTPTPAYDDSSPSKSLVRFPNGQDSGDDAKDWTATRTLTPGAANVVTEVCDDLLDNDGNMLVDCEDPACADTPECPEDCTNGVDDDGDMLVDCQDTSCDGSLCGMFGQVCASGACTCPGGNVEMACSGGVDDDCDGMVDCADTDCAMAPACITQNVTMVDYPVITHAGKLVITGAGFTGSTVVSIGGVSVPFVVDSGTQITVPSLSDAVPLGAQPLVVTTPTGDTLPFPVTVIHLLINELDCNQPSTDTVEFVEISTGVPGVGLAGYTLVFWNGNNDHSYFALDLDGTTDAAGLVFAGNMSLMPQPALQFTDSTLQNGEDAISVHQAPVASFPDGSTVTAANVIDAVVYGTDDPDAPVLLDTLIGPAGTPGRVQANEGSNAGGGASETQSLQRCGDGRRRGDKFAVGAPTPGAANTVAACP